MQTRSLKKTNEAVILNDIEWSQLIDQISLNQVWGVGHGRTLQFAKYNLKTVKDFLNLHPRQVNTLFGKEGVKLYCELNGQSVNHLESVKPKQKSVMSTRSFRETTTNLTVLNESIKYHIYQAANDLGRMNLLANRMTVMISPSHYGDYFLHGRRIEVVFTTPTANLLTLQVEAIKSTGQDLPARNSI